MIENDRLLDKIISQEIVNIVLNSSVIICDSEKKNDVYIELSKWFSNLKQHYISLEVSKKLNKEIFQKDKSSDNQNHPEIQEYFKQNDLKAQLQTKDTVINKLKEKNHSLRENTNPAKVKKDIDEIDIINIELEYSVAKLLSKNEKLHKEKEHLKKTYKELYDSIKPSHVHTKEQCDSLIVNLNSKLMENADLKTQIHEKVFANAALKNKLSNVKGKNVIDTAVLKPYATTIAPGMEHVDILREIVKHARALGPLDSNLDSASVTPKNKDNKGRFANPVTSTSNTRKQVDSHKPKDSNQPLLLSIGVIDSTGASGSKGVKSRKNKKNRVSKTECNAYVMQSVLNTNSKSVCAICNECLFDANHDKCVLDYVHDVNVLSKSKPTKRKNKKQIAKIIGYSDYQIRNVTISRVYYIEGLGPNLFSVGQFCDLDLEVAFHKHTCFVRNLEGVDLLTGSWGTNLYTLSIGDMMKSSPICLLSKASKTKSWLWHRHLSHLNFGTINQLAKQGLVRVIVDDYSRFTWVKFLRLKDEAPEFIIKFLKMIQVRLNVTVRNIRTNNGTKFVNQTLRSYYEDVAYSERITELVKKNDVYIELSKRFTNLEQYCISLEVAMQLNKQIFQQDKTCANQNNPEIQEYFEHNDLKAQLQAKDTVICKLKETIHSLRENVNPDKVKKDIDEIETINIELEHRKTVIYTLVSKPHVTTIALRMFKIDLEPLAPKVLKNKDAHLEYTKHSREHADILWEIVESARALIPLDSNLESACKYVQRIQEVLVYIKDTCLCLTRPSEKLVAVTPKNKDKKARVIGSTGASGSKPIGSTKNNKIWQSSSSNKTNKVKDQSRSVKSRKNKKNRVAKTECNDYIMQSVLNANSKSVCAICLPPDVYALVYHHKITKDIWDRVKLLMQGTSLSRQECECKLYDEFDKFSHVKGLAVPTFHLGDDPIACMNKAMAFLSAVFTPRYPSTNNQLRSSSNPRNQATVQDGRVTVQQVLGRQGQNIVGLGSQGNASGLQGNTSGQAKVIKCYNYQGEGHMARQCTQPKRRRDATWFKEKVLLVQAHAEGKELDEEHLVFLADPRVADGQVAQTITHNAAFQTDDLDAYDFDCDDISSAKAVLMANISICDSNVLSEANNESKIVNESLTAELERYKEQFKILEQRFNVYLSGREKFIDSLMDEMIRMKNTKFVAFKTEINTLKQALSKHAKEKESLLATLNAMHMLTKLQVFYDNTHKKSLGYRNPFYLKRAQRINPILYDGNVLSKTHDVLSVVDDEETLILAKKSRLKMVEKQNDPIMKKEKINITLINYSKLNKLAEYFGKRFVPQQELSTKQKFWLQSSDKKSEDPSTLNTPVKIKVPNKLPKFDKGLDDEITEVQTIFTQMEPAVEQCSVDRKCWEIQQKQFLIKNDRILDKIISQEIVNIVLNSSIVTCDSEKKNVDSVDTCNKCLELKAKLVKKNDVYIQLLKRFSNLKQHCISLEVAKQLNKEFFQKDKSSDNQNHPEIQRTLSSTN
ncbi:retrovirus-related pol polyprotein from transposon TNT 1-94 [Tanacetum coccineum]